MLQLEGRCLWLKTCKSCLILVVLLIGASERVGGRKATEVGADCLQRHLHHPSASVFGPCSLGEAGQWQGRARSDLASAAKDDKLKQWIVLWKEAEDHKTLSVSACWQASDPASGFRGKCSSTFNNVLHGISIQMLDSQLLSFLDTYGDKIASVHQDTGVVAHDIQFNPPWSIDRLDQAFLPLNQQYRFWNLGSSVNVYVIDTGIQTTHVEFRYPDGSPGSRASEAYTSLSSGRKGLDCNGHGTHVAGTVGGLTYGPAKNATLRAVRSLECLGNGTITQVIDGLDWLSKNYIPPAVAVLALGGDAQYALDQAAHNLVLAGVPVVVAAGNDGVDACTKSPARDPLAITVAATDTDDQRLWLSTNVASNVGTCVDIWAPGANILSASTRSDTASDFRSGTSQAAPYVAGSIALLLENATSAKPADLQNILNEWSVPNIVTEPTDSSPDGRRLLNSTKNALLNIPKSSPIVLSPSNCTLQPGLSENCTFSVTMSQVLTANVTINIAPSEMLRGSVTPSVLYFSPQNSSEVVNVTFNYREAALNNSRSAMFLINFEMSSNDSMYHNVRSRAWIFDKKGDFFTYPKVIQALPYQETGNTYMYENSYNLRCAASGTINAGRDVAYFFQPAQDANVTISLCGMTSQPFNTQLFLLADLNSTNISAIACNDDHCGSQSFLQYELLANVAYGILIESRDGKFGTYSINVTENQGNTVPGIVPSLQSLDNVHQNFPPQMLAQANQSSYLVSTVQNSPGRSPPTPRPAPPPLAVVGTIPGPDVSLALPPLTGLSDYNSSQAPGASSILGNITIANVLSPVHTSANSSIAGPPPQIVNVISPSRPSPPGAPLVSTSVQEGR